MVAESNNRELERLRNEREAKQPQGRFITLCWVLKAKYHESKEEARLALAATNTATERVAIVDRETGNCWTRPLLLRSVMQHLTEVEKSAPPRFRRVGSIGRLPKARRKKP